MRVGQLPGITPGVGKTMLAIGLARLAVEAGHRVYFTTAEDLAARCTKAAREGPVGHCDALLRRAGAIGDRRVWLSPAVRGRQRRAVPGDQSALPEAQRGVDLPCRDRVLGGATRGSDDDRRDAGSVAP